MPDDAKQRRRDDTTAVPKQWLTTAGAARRMGIDRTTLKRMIARGTAPPHVRIDEHIVRLRASDIDAWLEARTRGGAGVSTGAGAGVSTGTGRARCAARDGEAVGRSGEALPVGGQAGRQ